MSSLIPLTSDSIPTDGQFLTDVGFGDQQFNSYVEDNPRM